MNNIARSHSCTSSSSCRRLQLSKEAAEKENGELRSRLRDFESKQRVDEQTSSTKLQRLTAQLSQEKGEYRRLSCEFRKMKEKATDHERAAQAASYYLQILLAQLQGVRDSSRQQTTDIDKVLSEAQSFKTSFHHRIHDASITDHGIPTRSTLSPPQHQPPQRATLKPPPPSTSTSRNPTYEVFTRSPSHLAIPSPSSPPKLAPPSDTPSLIITLPLKRGASNTVRIYLVPTSAP